MDRCPNCRARSNGADTCRRCGMELGLLMAVENAAERLTTQGIAHLAAADCSAARRDLDEVIGLRREPFAELLLGFTRHLDATRSCTDYLCPAPEVSGAGRIETGEVKRVGCGE